MIRIIFILLLLFPFWASTTAQVSEIISNSSEKKNNTSNTSNSLEENNISSNSSDACVEACAEVCIQVAGSVFWEILANHHRKLMDRRGDDPTILSLDVSPQVCKSLDSKYNNMNFLPRVRGTWGVFSTEFYLNQLVEMESMNNYRTFGWQIFQLNLEAVPVFNFRIGTGVMWEHNYNKTSESTQNNAYNEHSISMDLKLNDLKYIFTIEGRTTWDYERNINVNYNLSFRGNIRLLETRHIYVYAVAGVDYQNYYTSIDWISGRAGFNFNLH